LRSSERRPPPICKAWSPALPTNHERSAVQAAHPEDAAEARLRRVGEVHALPAVSLDGRQPGFSDALHHQGRRAYQGLSLSCAGKPTASESARGGAGRGYVRHYAFQVRYHEIRHSGEEDAERSCLRGRRPTRTLAEDLTSVALAQVQIMYPAKFMLEAGESTPVITAGPEEAQKRGTGARTRGNMEGVALGTPAHRLGP